MEEEKDLQFVRDCVEMEGFDYAFMSYSDFNEVKDEEFHRLREAYIDATEQLASYINENTVEGDDL